MKQTLIWTALPNGIVPAAGSEKAYLRLSVFVTPRLSAPEAPRPLLTRFPDFLDWPAKLAGLTFTVHLEGRGNFPAERIPPTGDPAPSDLWKALFPSDTWVKSYEDPALNNLNVVSYPVTNIHARIREAYQLVATESPTALPQVGTVNPVLQPVFSLFRDVAITPQRSLTLRTQLQTQTRGTQLRAFSPPVYRSPMRFNPSVRALTPAAGAAAAPGGEAPTAVEFYQLQNFHMPATAKFPPLLARTLADTLDFHKIVSSVGQYPEILRRLGLVIDLKIPFVQGMAGATQIKVIPNWDSTTPTYLSTPRTVIVLSDSQFLAQPKSDSDIDNGQLRLDEPDRWDIGQIDLDGTALKVMDVARLVTIPTIGLAATTAALHPSPALSPHLAAPLAHGPIAPVAPPPSAPTTPPPPPQEAALPAMRSAGFWVARVDRVKLFVAMMTQVMSNNALLAQPGPPQDPVFYADDLIRGYRPDIWDDTAQHWYSLCDRVGTYVASKLTKTFNIEDEGWISSSTSHPEDDPTQLHLHETLFRWEGWSLSAPRPGTAVQGVGSTSSGAGNFGLDTSFLASPGTLPRLRFGRTYRIRARAVDLAGNSLSLTEAGADNASAPQTYFRSEPVPAPVVIPREDLTGVPGESVRNLIIRSLNDSPAKDSVPTTEISERHLAPPRTSEQMAELHGKLDTATGVSGGQATYDLIANREKNPESFYDVPQLEIPYLPDPLAAGMLIRLQPEPFADSPAEQTLQVPFDGDWPALQAVRLVLFEPAGPNDRLQWDPTKRVVRVPLRKADVAQIQISSYLRPEDLKLMEVWRWTAESVVAPAANQISLSPVERVQLQHELHDVQALPRWSVRLNLPQAQLVRIQNLGQIAQEGRHWMITPFTVLSVMHATQQPLMAPQYKHLEADRSIGQTFATIQAELGLSGKSSAKLDVIGLWDETIDPLGESKPRTLHGRNRVGERHLERADTDVQVVMTHEFHDTKYRHVSYKAVATSRFRECFPFSEDDIATGKVMITRGSQQETDVLSTARPLAPKVLYVIPTFGWEQTKGPNRVTSKRSGGGLRVYLERPWFSSGDGEQLGVVVPPAPSGRLGVTAAVFGPPGVSDSLKPYVTQWGADPLWRAEALPKLLLTPDDFPLAKNKESDLSLDELPGGTKVQVAGHAVAYDEERQLWYCDVEIDPGQAYYPFVRLALARYQPMSVKGPEGDVKLSRVVLADFAQLTPDRSAVLTYDPANKSHLTVSITGPSYNQSALGRMPEDLAVMEVTLEQRDPSLQGAISWSPVPDAVFPLKMADIGATNKTWSGDITLPAVQASVKYRLVVREYEMYQVDAQVMLTAMMVPKARGRRLVYADVLEI